jgi:hypothetical protein
VFFCNRTLNYELKILRTITAATAFPLSGLKCVSAAISIKPAIFMPYQRSRTFAEQEAMQH